jgi:hypothetical protein
MYQKQPQSQINLRVPEPQHDALKRLAKQRGVTVQHLVRAGIAAVTGVPDEIRRNRGYARGKKT